MIEHVGFVTTDIEQFERFWCGVLGYRKVREGVLSHDLTMALFGLPGGAITTRYSPPESGPDIEVHIFPKTLPRVTAFNRFGLNHVSLNVGDKQAFVEQLPEDVEVISYDNPGGWKNVFIRDYDGNWIEVRD